MNKHILLTVSFTLIFFCVNAKHLTIVDNNDLCPIAGVTVLGKSGVIQGLTDSQGKISISNQGELPVTIRCIGYEPITTDAITDTIRLFPAAYPLNEVVVTPMDRPISKIVSLVREYSSGVTGQDTMQLYCEYMAVSYIADRKVKGYKSYDARPSTRNARRYARIRNSNITDSIFSPKRDDDICELSWLDFMAFIPTENVEITEAIRNGAELDSIPGKYGTKFLFRKKNNLFTKTADVLSDHKNRKWSPFLFKLIGMTIDIDDANWTLIFNENENNIYNHNNFVEGIYNIHMLGKGKWIKKAFNTNLPVEMYSYLELIPIETTHLTIDEYKVEREDYTAIDFQYPKNLQPISPAIQNLVDRIDTEQRLK